MPSPLACMRIGLLVATEAAAARGAWKGTHVGICVRGYHSWLILPAIYPILDTALLARLNLTVIDAAEALVEGGARILQLRHKDNWTHEVYHTATELASFLRAAGVEFVINDRADIAKMLGAGLHVGQEDLPVKDARAILSREGGTEAPRKLKLAPLRAAILGLSTHNEKQLRAAAGEPADYLALGPIFGTASKANPDPIIGVAELARLRPLTSKPLVAIGGIRLETAGSVWRAGADSIALIGDLFPASGKAAVRARMEAWVNQATMEKSLN